MKKIEATQHTEGWTERARQLLAAQGLTYTDVLEALNVGSIGAVSHYFQARRELSAEQAVALAVKLDCSVEWLLTGALPSSTVSVRAVPVTLPSPDEICALIRGLRPELYAAIAQVISAVAPRAQPRKKNKPVVRKHRKGVITKT